MCRYSAVSTAVVLSILMISQGALAAEGTIFTPGQIVINYGNTAVVKVSNHTSSPLVNVVVLAARRAVELGAFMGSGRVLAWRLRVRQIAFEPSRQDYRGGS